ncbi:MAG: 16S rRNA (guanine(966)-N(2))-methyltransferase RsmD [Elioraea sp.]|nr:16S rRNA (guanine(966)-N(2))-methyltransferase RsmD [Elioraea sp.]
MRIIAGAHRGRRHGAPEGLSTRPTSGRLRQALFDMLRHAPWGGRQRIEGARVLDAFAGSGALGLEALSRGAAEAVFLESDPAALAALRANIAACREQRRARVLAADALAPPRADSPCGLLFLDPPYGRGLLAPALSALSRAGWVAPGAIVVVETAAGAPEELPRGCAPLAERRHGAGMVRVYAAGPFTSLDSLRS